MAQLVWYSSEVDKDESRYAQVYLVIALATVLLKVTLRANIELRLNSPNVICDVAPVEITRQIANRVW
jgi:hypothetical protein